jgi:fructokinase
MLVWSIGEILWDVFPDGERFGGAPLNLCVNMKRLGAETLLLSAVGEDERGVLALERMRSLGISTRGVSVVEDVPTGAALVTFTAEGEPSYSIPRPAAFDFLSVDAAILPSEGAPSVDWLYCQTQERVEHLTTELAGRLKPARGFYDMNLRTGQWNLALVQRLSGLASILKLNEEEARTLFALTAKSDAEFSLDSFCETWSSAYEIDLVCVTLGPDGCLIYASGTVHRVPGFKVSVADTVGSGDAFAAAFLHGYSMGWPIVETARFANALGALVASRPGATPEWNPAEVLTIFGETDKQSSL